MQCKCVNYKVKQKKGKMKLHWNLKIKKRVHTLLHLLKIMYLITYWFDEKFEVLAFSGLFPEGDIGYKVIKNDKLPFPCKGMAKKGSFTKET